MPSSGNAPRVAVLVHNDATNDSRVLKESTSLREQGARVRIVAVERRLKGRTAGTSELAPGLDLHRVPEFALERIAPALTRLTRRPAATASSAAAAPPQVGRPSPLAAARRLGTRVAGDLGRRAYRTIELGTWWWRSARAAHAFAPEIVHANDTNALVPALAIQALGRREGRRVRLVYDSHELWRHRNVEGRRLLAPLLDAAIEHVAIPRADVVITVSPSIAEWLRRTYRLDRLPLVVRNVPVAGPLPDRGTGVLRERAGLPASDRVIAYGGRS